MLFVWETRVATGVPLIDQVVLPLHSRELPALFPLPTFGSHVKVLPEVSAQTIAELDQAEQLVTLSTACVSWIDAL